MAITLDKNRIPQHVAIIMDGNGRWAMDSGLDRTYGHKAGVEAVNSLFGLIIHTNLNGRHAHHPFCMKILYDQI